MKANFIFCCAPWWSFLAILLGVNIVLGQQTTAFTYQGQLRDNGTNANGAYTMVFKLYDAGVGGNQIGTDMMITPTLANGLFTVNLDFGAGAFDGNARWLDITVTNGPDTQTLSPRVQFLPAPYAQFSAVAGTVTSNAVATTNIQRNAIITALIADGAVANRNVASNSITSDKLASDPAGLARVSGGAAYVANNGQVSFTGGGITLAHNFGTNGNSLCNLENGFISTSTALGTTLASTLNFVGASGINLMQVVDYGSSGGVISRFAGDGGGLTNVSAVPNMQVFIGSSGTFTVPSNVARINVEMWVEEVVVETDFMCVSDTTIWGIARMR
jgi:hypothetical protein